MGLSLGGEWGGDPLLQYWIIRAYIPFDLPTSCFLQVACVFRASPSGP